MMSDSNLTALAQIGIFPLGHFQSSTTPAINTTTIIASTLSELLPVHNTSLTKNVSEVFEGLYYGGVDTPTTRQLSLRIAALERGKFAVLAPSGQNACHLIIAATATPGDHILVCDNITYSTQWLIDDYFGRLGIEIEYFAPNEAATLSSRLKHNTKIVFWESPGAFTYELVDAQAIVNSCNGHSALTIIDNTWAASTFYHPLNLGVDAALISMTKSHAAVSGKTLGAVVTSNQALFERIKTVAALLGSHVDSDACASALLSMSTLGARLSFQMATTVHAMKVLAELSQIKLILHPTNADDSNQFARDYSGFNSLISVEFKCPHDEVIARIDRLKVIKFGYGWGGPISLISLFEPSRWPSATRLNIKGSCARIYLGLEDAHEIEIDLRNAFGS